MYEINIIYIYNYLSHIASKDNDKITNNIFIHFVQQDNFLRYQLKIVWGIALEYNYRQCEVEKKVIV